jgi:replicative DNA helicase
MADNQQHRAGADRPKAKLYWLNEIIPGLIADNDAAIEARKANRPRGPQTGIKEIDDALGGFFAPGALHLLQASPGAGKTALALQTASDCCYPALYVSAEMPVFELVRRLIARQTSTFLGKLRSGEIGSDALRNLALAAAENLSHLAFMDATTGVATVDYIRQSAEAMREEFKSETVLVILDSLHVWARGLLRGMGGEFEIVSEGTSRATELAAILQSPVLAICHRNREGNKSAKGAGLHAGRGSGDLEYEAWTLLDLHRDMDQREDASGEVDVAMRFYKNRSNGLTPAIHTKFCGRLQTFRGAADGN